ncbi:MAG: hypothetical protein ABI874_05890, partial [Chloroflexota bacterium]
CVPFAPNPSQAQAYLFQIFSARWDYGNRGDWLDAVPLQLGIAPVGLSIIALVTRPDRRAIQLAVITAVLCALSIVPFSSWWPWAWLLNAPWQLLGVAGFTLSLLGGSLIARHSSMATLPALAAVVTLTLLASYAYLAPRGIDYTPTHLPLARFGDSAQLVAVESPPLHAGATVMATLWWLGSVPFADDYTVFVHVVDPQGKLWAQRDAQPLRGARPTHTWQRGELLRDDYALTIPANAPADLQIEVGLYRGDNGQRLRTTNGDDRVIIKP